MPPVFVQTVNPETFQQIVTFDIFAANERVNTLIDVDWYIR